MDLTKYYRRRSSFLNPSSSLKNVNFYSLNNNINLNRKIYEQKLKSFLEDIKLNKIKYNLLKILFEYEDNFRLVCDIYQKFIKSKLEMEILNFYLKSLGNFISLIHSDEPMTQLDNIINTVNKYLRVNTYSKNTILFRIRDIGTKYYILLKGKIVTLLPRKFIKAMTFEEYRNHLNILYILGEDYLLEKTMHSNIQSFGIPYSDIDNNNNKILRNIYLNNYCCNYEKYIRLINADEHIKIENYDSINNNDDSEEEEKNKTDNKNKYEKNQNDKINKKNDINDDNEQKKKKNKYHKIIKCFNKHFIFNKNENEINNFDSIYNIDLNDVVNNKEDNKEVDDIRYKLKKKLKDRKNKDEEKDNEDINSFNIGIPKELLTKDIVFKYKHKYDGGDLPTFFARNKNNYLFYEDEKDENSKNEESKNNINNDNHKNNINKIEKVHFNHVLNLRRNFYIVGYDKIGTLLPGMSFGEISLLNEDHRRTCTIFIEEDSMIGRLNLGEYNITIKSVRAKIRTDSINFLLNTRLFGDISYLYFLNKYWIYFQCKNIHKGDFLFKIGDTCENIYIIYSGEIKLSSYIDKENINDLINGIEHKRNKKINYFLNKMKYINSNKNSSNSIFERKQKYCLMIGKKGDIIGLNDIINYYNNKYICEGEVTSDYLSYYEINKTIIFNQLTNISNNGKNTLNIDNIYYIIKTKQDFMLNKLNNIKISIEQRHKFLQSEEENNKYENNNIMNIKNKNELNKIYENKNKLNKNKNKKSLSLNSFNLEYEKKKKKNKINLNEKHIISSTFFKNEIIKENINNLLENEDPLVKRKLSENRNKIISLNKLNKTHNSNLNNTNYAKTIDSSLSLKNITNFKKNVNNAFDNNINNNLTLFNGNKKNKINNENNKNLYNLSTYNKNNNSTNNKNNNSISNISSNNNNIYNNSTIKIEEIENITKCSSFSPCKPYEFPNIHNENNSRSNLNLLKKNKILKFLFLSENDQKYKLFKYYKSTKNNIHNYFIDTLKSNLIKNINIFDSDNIQNNSYKNKRIYNSINNNIHSENRYLNNQTEKYKLDQYKINLKKSKLNYIFKTKNNKGIDTIKNDLKTTLKNKNIQVNINNKNYKKNSLLKNFYSLSIKNKKKRMQKYDNLFPQI